MWTCPALFYCDQGIPTQCSTTLPLPDARSTYQLRCCCPSRCSNQALNRPDTQHPATRGQRPETRMQFRSSSTGSLHAASREWLTSLTASVTSTSDISPALPRPAMAIARHSSRYQAISNLFLTWNLLNLLDNQVSTLGHLSSLLFLIFIYYYHGFTVRYSVLVTGTENTDIKMRYLLKAGLYVLQNARLCTCIVTINILLYNQ